MGLLAAGERGRNINGVPPRNLWLKLRFLTRRGDVLDYRRYDENANFKSSNQFNGHVRYRLGARSRLSGVIGGFLRLTI